LFVHLFISLSQPLTKALIPQRSARTSGFLALFGASHKEVKNAHDHLFILVVAVVIVLVVRRYQAGLSSPGSGAV
jgi:hypothetical protein